MGGLGQAPGQGLADVLAASPELARRLRSRSSISRSGCPGLPTHTTLPRAMGQTGTSRPLRPPAAQGGSRMLAPERPSLSWATGGLVAGSVRWDRTWYVRIVPVESVRVRPSAVSGSGVEASGGDGSVGGARARGSEFSVGRAEALWQDDAGGDGRGGA